MSLVLATVAVATAIWLFFKLLLVEFPSLGAISAMKKIGGPKGLPFFIGETWNFMRMKSEVLMDYLEDLKISHPRMTAFYMAGIPMVHVQKPQDIKHILESTKNIKKGSEYRLFNSWLNEGLLISSGIKWHTRRKMLTPTFHFKILEDALSGMSRNSDILADKLHKTGGKIVTVEEYVTRCTLDIMAETAMGVQLEAQAEEGSQYLKCVHEAARIIMHRILSIYLMKDTIFALSPSGYQYKNCLKVLHAFTDKVIEERKEVEGFNDKPDEDVYGRKPKKAFLDSLLSMQKANPQSFTNKDIREEVDTFMFEGHDTTSAGVSFGLWLIGSNPEVQEQLYQEIINEARDGEITRANINNMHYLERVVKETLRLYPSVPMMTRRLTEDIILDDGFKLTAGLNVLLIPFLLHRDSEAFPDPEKFDPDRFLEDASVGRHPYAYIPFSAGPRNCIGQKFALLEMKLILASVIRKCKIESITKREDFKILPHLIARPTVPLKCRFVPRNK